MFLVSSALTRRSLRCLLLASAAVLVAGTAQAQLLPMPGTGGAGGGGAAGGSPSLLESGAAGEDGRPGPSGAPADSGGGGGSGSTGGNGGSVPNTSAAGGTGGSPGTTAGQDGGDGGRSGGGGGGGAHDFVGDAASLVSDSYYGGGGGQGGDGESYGGGGGGGGYGAVVSIGAGATTLDAQFTGGAGGSGGAGSSGGSGGAGGAGLAIQVLTGAADVTFTASASAIGGAGGGTQGDEAFGGMGGAGLLFLNRSADPATLTIAGTIIGGTGGLTSINASDPGGQGGAGLLIDIDSNFGSPTVNVNSAIFGGAGGAAGDGGYYYRAGTGGAGILGYSLASVFTHGPSTLNINAQVSGGAGGANAGAGPAGTGGAGIDTIASSIAIAAGVTVAGGAGGSNSGEGRAGDGGVGINAAGVRGPGNTITVAGGATIIGGAGGVGSSDGLHGSGGYGVSLGGNRLVLQGTAVVSGGLGGDGATRAFAISLGVGTATLEIQADADGNLPTLIGGVKPFYDNEASPITYFALGGTFDKTIDADTLWGYSEQFVNLEKTGTSTWTLTGDFSRSTAAWTISEGTLSISDDNNLGAVYYPIYLNGGTLLATADITSSRSFGSGDNGGTFSVAAGKTMTLSGDVSGWGALTKSGDGTLTLTGANSLTGATTVGAGTLVLSGGSLGGSVDVVSGATLKADASGGGVGGNVDIAAGGKLSGISGATTFGVNGNVSFADATSIFAVTLEAPSSTAALGVGGDLALNGVLDLTAGTGFSSGSYRLIDYAGTLAGSGLTLGTAPTHSLYEISTSTANQVNLVVAAGQWWNGARLTPGTGVEGGDGEWNVSAGSLLSNWTDATGTTAAAWSQGGLAIFAGTAGTVTVGGSTAPQVAAMEFLVDGYLVTGGSIDLVTFGSSTAPTLMVGEGASAAEMTATVGAALSGTSGLEKTGLGTLNLSGANSLSGDVTVSAGTLGLSGTLGASVLTVGSDLAGTLAVSGGGALTSINTTVGTASGGIGTVTVSGPGSSWTSTGELSIGLNGGTGSVTVSDGAAFTARRTSLSTASWQSGSGGTGSLTVTGKDTVWTNTGGVEIARTAGSTGSLTVSGGATAHITGTGLYAGAGAQVTFTGPGTRVEIGDPDDSAQAAWLSPDGGTVTVSEGADVYASGVYVGAGGGDLVTMTVSGAATVLQADVRLYVGGQNGTRDVDPVNGRGELTISDGAKVTSASIGAGMDPKSEGKITITGADSQLWAKANSAHSAPGNFYVGYNGTASVLVTGGGTLKADNELRIGYADKGDGVLSIGGAKGSAAAAAGVIDAPKIVFGTGTGEIVFNHTATDYTLAAPISGAGQVNVLAGTTILTGANTYTGGTSIAAGSTLQIGGGGQMGSLAGNVANAGTLAFNRSDDITFAGIVSGTGTLSKFGAGTLTLTGANSLTGATTVIAGALQIGDGGTTGSLAGAIVNSGTVTFNRSDDIVASGAITGSGGLVQRGGGKLTLTGANSAAAGTTVEAGTLEILSGVSLASAVTVKSGATLQGETSGTSGAAITGAVSIETGGTLAAAPTTTAGAYGLSMTSLSLASGANIDVTLGTNTGNAVFSAGTLALDGVLNVTDGGSMVLGVYRLVDYTTLASDGGLVLGATPLQYAYEVQQSPGQVNLAVLDGSMLYWNGSQTAPDNTIHGGDGSWTSSSTETNWTTAPANQSRAWNSSFAVFSGAKGTVTIDDIAGAVSVTGAQFMVDGYEVTGDALTLAATSGQTQIRVGDGAGDGASYIATIGAVIGGSTGLEKTDLGTLILTATNTYTGGTTITQGRLQIGNGGTSGSIQGDIVNNAALVFNRANDLAYSGAISGSGRVVKEGAGTLLLNGTNSFGGGLTISEGTVQAYAASALGTGGLALAGSGALQASTSFSYADAITLTPAAGAGGGTFKVDDNARLTLTGAIGGTGVLEKQGGGTLAIATNSYSGATYVGAGALEISGGASLSDSARLTVASGATLTLTDANETIGSLAGGGDIDLGSHCLITGADGTSSTFAGAMSGAGCVTKTGDGTLTLTGTNTHAGTTAISGGTIQVYGASALGSGPLALEGPGTLRASETFTSAAEISLTPTASVGGGTFEVDDSKTLTLTGAIAGLGSLSKSGTGTLVLGGANSYSGATEVAAGTVIATGGQAIGDASAVNVALGAQFTLQASETVGSISGVGGLLLDGATLSVGGNQASTAFSGSISGTGGLTKSGSGVLTLSGTNTYAGDTSIAAGGLVVTGSLDGDVYVQDLAFLSGTGTINKTVYVLDGGTLSGEQASGLTMGGLNLSAAASVDVTLGAPSAGSVFAVNGDLTLDGTMNVTEAPGFGLGIYRVVNYSGTLTDNGMTVGALSGGLVGGIQSAIPNQINLFVEDPNSPILFWNGSNTAPTQSVLGGAGTWTADAQTNWINASGTISQSWNSAFAVFQGTPGTVTVDNVGGQVTAAGMQFVESGYLVTGGSLALIGSAPAPIRVGDGTAQGAGTSATIASELTGSSGLEKADFGTLILTGENSYGGGTLISGGTLQIGDGGTSGSILGDVANAGVLTFNRGDDVSFAGVISGSGSLQQTGAGTLHLTGSNSFSGGTTIAAGTLRVDNAGALGSGGLTVGAAGTLRASSSFTYGTAITLDGAASTAGTFEVDGAQALTLSGVLSGGGGLNKTGAGTLILTGENTFAGVTTISEGTLQIGNGGTAGSIPGDVVNHANLIFNRSDTYAFTGSISGDGEVTFMGGGTVLFSSPYSGAVTVDASIVQLEPGSSTPSSFTVNAGGVLGGAATIGGLMVNSGGVVAPGNSPGTLTVNGAVSFGAGSVYRVDVTPDGEHDRIVASGAVTLSSEASVEVVAVPGLYPATSTVPILTTSGTLTGTFGSVSSDFAFLDPKLSYDAQNVFLSMVYNGVDFVEYAQTSNQAGVAVAAQALGAGNAVYEAIFALPEAAVAPAFDQLSGEIYASAPAVVQQQSVYLREAVGSRLRQSVTNPSAAALSDAAKAAGPTAAQLGQNLAPTVWVEGLGGWGDSSGDGNAATVTNTFGGIFGGVDVAVTDNLRVGLVGGYSRTWFDVDARSSSASMNNYDIGLYAGAQLDAFALRGGASYTWHDVSASRAVVFPGYYGANGADYSLGTTQLFGEVGYEVSAGGYDFEPFAGLAYVNVSGGSFTESGTAASALSVEAQALSTLYSTLGLRAATTFDVAGHTLTPSATLGWQHAFGDTAPSATMLFAGGVTPFNIQGAPLAENMALIGLGLGVQMSGTASLQFDYAGQIAEQASQNTFSAQFSVKF